MKLVIEIENDNDAFAGDGQRGIIETVRILNTVIDKLNCARFVRNIDGEALHDYNGNRVGKVEVTA